jgi:hypothetical protein
MGGWVDGQTDRQTDRLGTKRNIQENEAGVFGPEIKCCDGVDLWKE